MRIKHFAAVVDRYLKYVGTHSQYCFASTLEGITDKYNTSHLYSLFAFLGEELTGKIRRTATARASRQKLQDWTEEKHVRLIKKLNENGTQVVEKKEYAFTKKMAIG